MNKWIGILLAVSLLASCSKEDDLTPSGARDEWFTLSPTDTAGSPLNALRYRFYEENNVHLMFNDTLRHELRGTYADGSPYWYTEVIDFSYSMESTPGSYRWEYVTDFEEQKKSAAFLEKYILSHLGGVMSPYSVFLVKDLEERYGSGWRTIDFYSGMRCFVLNVSDVLELEDEEEIAVWGNDFFYNMLNTKFTDMYYANEVGAFAEFDSFSAEYYGAYLDEFEQWEEEDPTQEELYEIGLFEFFDVWGKYFPYANRDRRDYLQKIFYWEEEVPFEEYFADYPVMVKKYEALKKVIEDLGYKF